MLILLPPSEGKAAPADGRAGRPRLAGLRRPCSASGARGLLDALERLAKLPRGRAIGDARRLQPGQAGEVDVDARLRVGAGGAGRRGLHRRPLRPPRPRRRCRLRARRRVLIASALWGVVGPEDRIPYYRLSAKARLTRIGRSPAWWRDALAEAMPDEPGELDRRHALRRLRRRLEAEAGDLAGGARLQRERRRAQAGLPHGEGGARRRRPGAARGEEAAGGPRGRRRDRRGRRLRASSSPPATST